MTRNNADFDFGKQGHKIGIFQTATPDEWEDAIGASEETKPKNPSIIKLYSNAPLVTGQGNADTATIQKYRKTPSSDVPMVFTHQGAMWIHDGHHRIVASRLNGDDFILVKHWNTGE